jgi:aryl-alcohol dehydrogenase-like predicted oxidoreductase
MEFNNIKNINLKVSRMGFGAWAIGSSGYGEVSEADAHKTLESYVEEGGNFIDTARCYGKSEERIGNFLKKNKDLRDKIVIATKTLNNDEKKIKEDIETSLNKLRTDRIDLFYLHLPPEDIDEMDSALTVLQSLKEEGMIMAIGSSVKGPDVDQSTVDLCRKYIRDSRVDALEVAYSIFRQKTSEIFKEAKEAGIAIVARSILESGFLTGKYKPGDEFSDHRSRWSRERLVSIFEDVKELKDLAVKLPFNNITQVAIRFALDNPFITSIIPGARNADQLKKNMEIEYMPELGEDIKEEIKKRFYSSYELFNTDRSAW